MTGQPLVSFIIPAFNQEKYLADCLDSILRTPADAYEIILVDDASTDGTETICRRYVEARANVSYNRMPENRGPGAARNLGIAEAQGRFLAFPDSDDTVDSGALAEILAVLAANPDVDALCPNHTIMDANGVLREKAWVTERGRLEAADLIEKSPFFACCPLWTFFVRSGFVRELGLVMPETYGMEDLAFTLAVFSRARQVYALPMSWYIHRNNPGSLSNRMDSRHNEDGFAAYCRAFAALPEEKRATKAYAYALRKTIAALTGTASDGFLDAVAAAMNAGDRAGSDAVGMVAGRFAALTAAIRAMPGAGEKGVHLFPATMFSPNAARLIEASGIPVKGMFDNNPSPENHQAALCRAAGYEVRPWSELADDMLAVVYCFEPHTAEAVAGQLEKRGLTRGARYVSFFDW